MGKKVLATNLPLLQRRQQQEGTNTVQSVLCEVGFPNRLSDTQLASLARTLYDLRTFEGEVEPEDAFAVAAELARFDLPLSFAQASVVVKAGQARDGWTAARLAYVLAVAIQARPGPHAESAPAFSLGGETLIASVVDPQASVDTSDEAAQRRLVEALRTFKLSGAMRREWQGPESVEADLQTLLSGQVFALDVESFKLPQCVPILNDLIGPENEARRREIFEVMRLSWFQRRTLDSREELFAEPVLDWITLRKLTQALQSAGVDLHPVQVEGMVRLDNMRSPDDVPDLVGKAVAMRPGKHAFSALYFAVEQEQIFWRDEYVVPHYAEGERLLAKLEQRYAHLGFSYTPGPDLDRGPLTHPPQAMDRGRRL